MRRTEVYGKAGAGRTRAVKGAASAVKNGGRNSGRRRPAEKKAGSAGSNRMALKKSAGTVDYRTFYPGLLHLAGMTAGYLVCAAAVGWLFFGRFWAALFLLPGIPFFIKNACAYLGEKRRKQLNEDFRDALDLLSIALKAGNSVERAFPAVARELVTLKGKKAPITREFRWIAGHMALQVPVEELLEDLAHRSGSEDIRNFAGVFSAAKRMGGSMTEVVRSAADVIGGKIDVEKEIRSSLAAKKHEQLIMTVMPCGILLYMKTASPGFLDVMYTTALGICVMAAALAVYLAAALWGRKIVDIQV